MNKTLFFHGLTKDKSRFTLAGKIEEDDMVLGISLCSEIDQFEKKAGRVKAEGRMLKKANNKGRYFIGLYTEDFKHLVDKSDLGRKGVGFKEGYFKGKEVKLFVNLAKDLSKNNKRNLQKTFGLNNR